MTRTRAGRMLLLAVGTIAALALQALLPGRAEAQPMVFRAVNVNCAVPGQTIANALRRQVLGQGLIVRVSGTCNEHVHIFRDDVTLRGNPTATINGPTATDDAVSIEGARRVALENLTITGGEDGVAGVRGAVFTLENVTVQSTARFGVVASYGSQGFIDASVVRQAGNTGVLAANGSSIVITNSTVEQNAGTGLQAIRSSNLRIGQDAAGSAALGPVIVQNNTGNGVIVSEGSAGVIVASTIQNNTSNGMYIGRASHADIGSGSFSILGPNTIQNNGPSASGILVEGASANIVGNIVTGNGFGVQFLNGANGRFGIRPDGTAYAGNNIFSNRLHGILLNSGATAVIGGNNVSANGTAGSVGNRMGIFASQSAVNLIGQNMITDNPESGIFVRQGSLFVGNGFGSLPTTGNVIRNNGCATNAGNRSGVFMFEGATGEIRNTLVTENCGPNMTLVIGTVLDLRSSNVSQSRQLPGVTTFAPGIQIGTRSTLRPGTGVLIDDNQGDGIFLSNGATLEIRNDVSTTISNNDGVSINCQAGQTQNTVAYPTTPPGPTIFSGNGTDAPSANCVPY
jgi:hypothetical protein